MEPTYWHQRWADNEIGFHQEKINSRLRRLWPDLKIPAGDTVFLPLCGKSLDMLWFIDQGYQVLGVELSAVACEDFFVENGLKYTVSQRGHFTVYGSEGISLLAGDFFDLTADDLSHVSGIYDRASLIALPDTMRVQYSDHLAAVLQTGCQGILISMTYDTEKMEGPPFSVGEEEIRSLLESKFFVDVIAESSGPNIVGELKKRGLDTLDEKVYRLARLP